MKVQTTGKDQTDQQENTTTLKGTTEPPRTTEHSPFHIHHLLSFLKTTFLTHLSQAPTFASKHVSTMGPDSSYGLYALGMSQLYENTTTPNTRSEPPDTSDWWVCCQCNREVNPVKDGDICPDCQHKKDEYCTTTKHPTTPIKQRSDFDFEAPIPASTPSYSQQAGIGYQKHTHYANAQHQHAHDGCYHNVHSLRHHASPVEHLPTPGYEYTPPPNMNGWWRCCQCSTDINRDWYGTDCTNCGHVKCVYCTDH